MKSKQMKSKQEEKKQNIISLKIGTELVNNLDYLADERGMNRSAFIRQLITEEADASIVATARPKQIPNQDYHKQFDASIVAQICKEKDNITKSIEAIQTLQTLQTQIKKDRSQ